MKLTARLAVAAGILALGSLPAVALGAAGGNSRNSRAGGSTTLTTGSGPSSRAKAYGKLCQGESKKHVAGTPGTPFSKCVTDMAQIANGSTTNPANACQNESKKHVAGTPGTPYSTCVSGAKKLLKDQPGT
jgi:hypothetical protein